MLFRSARPRVRRTDGGGEVPLETYVRLQSPDAMPQAVLRRMARGVSTRDYADVIDLIPDGFGVKKSSVSRDFVRASASQVKALAERRFDGTNFPVLMIDGVEYAGETMIVAVGITADGTKRVLGLRQGATENATVCVAPRPPPLMTTGGTVVARGRRWRRQLGHPWRRIGRSGSWTCPWSRAWKAATSWVWLISP